MATEDIGGVSISIGGDSSDLKEALDRAIQAAEAAGQNISEAIAKAYEGGAGNLKQALDQIGASADGLKNAAQPMADTVTQAGAALQSTGEQASTAGGKLDEFSEHAHGAGEAAHEAHGGAHELLEGLLEFAGIAVTIEALKEFVTEAVEVYAHTEKIQISLGYLSGSTKEAAEEIEKLKGFAMNLAVPFDAAAEAAQKFSASGLEFPQINEALRAAADVAAATGTSFETAAGKMDSLANSSVVGARQLKTLKITTEDLAEAMGIRTDQIKTAWAGMDVEQRMDAMTTAAQKFQGAGDALAKGTGGQLQQIKNAWHETMDSVGESIAPITATVLPALLDGFKYVVAGVEGAIGVIKVVVDTVKGVFAEVYSAVSGFAVAVAKVTSGDMKGAVDTLGDTFKNLEIIESATSQKIQSDTLQTAFQLQDLFGKTAKSAEDSGDRQAKAHAAAGAAAALAAAETKKAMEEVDKFGQSAQALLDKIPEAYGDYVSKLQDGGATATSLLKNVSSELDKAGTAMANLRGEPLRAMQEWVDELKAAQDKLRDFADSDEFRKIGDKVAGIGAKFVEIKPQILNVFNDVLGQMAQIPGAVARDGDKLITWLGEVVKAQDALDKQIQTTQKTMDAAYIKYEERTRSQTIPITVTLAERFAGVTTGAAEANKKLDEMGDNGPGKVLELVTAIGTLHLSVDGLTDREREALQAFDKVFDSGTTKLPIIEGAWNAVSAAIATLAKVNMPEAIRQQGLYVDALVRANAPHADILRAQEAMYANQVKLAQEQGTGWSAYGIALDEAKRKQQEHIDATGRMYEAYKDLQKIVGETFKGIEDGIATAIVDGKNLGDTLEAVGKKIAKEFIEDVLKMALDPMKKALEDMVSKLFPSIISSLGGLATIGKDAQSAVDDLGHSVVMAAAGFGQAGEAAGKMATSGTTAVGTATSGITGVGGAASSATTALTGWISAIGSAVGALASIGSFVTSLETNHKLAVIEENTRKTEILLDQIGHGIWTGTDLMTGYLNNIMTHAWVLPDISAHTLAAQQLLEHLVNNGIEITGAIGTVSQAIQQTKTATEGAAASSAAAAAAAAATAAGTQATANAVEASGRVSANATMTAALRTIDELEALKGTLLTQSDAALAAGDLQSAALLRGQADQIDQQIKAIKDSSIFQVSHTIEALQAVQAALVGAQNDAILHGDAAAAAVIQGQLDSIGSQISELEQINEKLGVYGQATNENLTTSNSSLERIHGAIQSSAAASSAAITGGLNDALSATNAAIITLEAREMALLAAEQTAMDRGDLNAAAIIQNEINNTAQQIDTLKAQLPDITAAIHQQSGVIQQEGVSSRGAVQTNTGVLNGLHDALNAAKDAIVTLEAREMTLIAAEQTAIDRGDLNAAAVIRAEINNTAQQIDALKAQVPNITDAIAHQSGVIQQEGVLSRGAIAKSQDDVKTALQLEHDVLIKMSQDQTDIGNATQAAIFKAQADAVQKQIDAIGTSATKIESAIGRDEQSGKTNADKITTAIQISGAGSLTALFGMRDTLIAGLTAARDQIVALQRSLIAAGEISTAATLDVQINGLNAQITALKTSTAAVTAATAGGAAAITGVIGTAADGIKDTFSSGTGNVVDTLTVGFKAITDSQVAGAQQVAAAVVASSKMGVNPLTGNIPPGTFPGETYGATGNPIAPGFYFNSGSIAQRQTESQLAQAALYAGDWNAWQYALSTFAAASGGSIPAWAEINPGTGVGYTPDDLAANALAHHTGGSITGLHSFDAGGLITADQIAQVHAGEVILTAQATQDLANYTKQTAELQREIADIQKRIDVELRDGNLTASAAANLTLETLRHQLTEAMDAQAAVKSQWMEGMAKLNTQEIVLQSQLAAQQQQSAMLVSTLQTTQDLARYSQQSVETQQEIVQVNNKIAVDIASGNNEALAQDRAQLAVLKEQFASTEAARIAAAAHLAALQIQQDELKKQTLLAQQQLTATLALPLILNPPAGGSPQVPGSPIITGPPTGGSQQVPSLPIIMGPPAGGSPGNGPVPLASAITNLEKYLENQLTTEELRKLRAQIGNESLIDYYRHTLTQAEWANIQRFVGTPGLFPSFATGIDYVPYDMTARIHEGERVLNRGEAQAYGTGPQNINITVNGANVPNPRELARMIGDHVKSVTSNNQVRR